MTDSTGVRHTAGPWKFSPWHIEEGPSAVLAPAGWIVCTTSNDDDARLIAAAPELLEALKRMLLEFDFMVEREVIPDVRDDIIFVNARAALSRATGGA